MSQVNLLDTNSPVKTYNHIDVGDIRNSRRYRICGAMKKNGEYCQHSAGQGTSHPGEGRCVHHGGGSPSGMMHGSYKHGRYSQAFTGKLAEYYRQVDTSDDNPVDIIPELKAVQALFAFQIAEFSALVNGATASEAKRIGIKATEDVIPKRLLGGPSPGYDRKLKAANSPGASTGGESGMGGNVVERDSADIPHGKFSISTPQEAGSVASAAMSTLSHPEESPELSARINLQKLGALLETSRQISDMIQKITTMRNNTAYTKAEVMFILSVLQDAMNEFVPKDKQGEYIEYLKRKSGDILGRMMAKDEAEVMEAEVVVEAGNE